MSYLLIDSSVIVLVLAVIIDTKYSLFVVSNQVQVLKFIICCIQHGSYTSFEFEG